MTLKNGTHAIINHDSGTSDDSSDHGNTKDEKQDKIIMITVKIIMIIVKIIMMILKIIALMMMFMLMMLT